MKTKKNLYFREVIKRQNKLKDFILNLFFGLSSYPRLLLEVFIRRNLGERYFSLASAITVAIILLLLPYVSDNAFSFFRATGYGYGRRGGDPSDFWSKYATWYLFIVGFLYFSYRRWQEVRRNPSVFDFARFSLTTGNIHPFFFNVQVMGIKASVRTIETVLEPAAFFIIGFILYQFGQNVGMLLIVCSIFYGIGYAGAYKLGDDFVMDHIDELIMNEQMQGAFVEDLSTDKTKGVRFYMRKPTTREGREWVGDSFFEDDDNEAAAAS